MIYCVTCGKAQAQNKKKIGTLCEKCRTRNKEDKLKLYSNEIVFRGHPDKVCDQIAGALLDAYLSLNPNARAGIEVMGSYNGTSQVITVAGEINTPGDKALTMCMADKIVNRVLADCGYPRGQIRYEMTNQSPDIAQGVDNGGAGDNGMMFGYACNDTPEMLPTAQVILQKFAKSYDELRQQKTSAPSLLGSDGKAQITGEYDADFKLKRIKTFTICYQNYCNNEQRTWQDVVLMTMAKNIAKEYGIEIDEFLINPTGKFEIGGFRADAGLTGRKIQVDAYQTFANVGGGSMNGKDPSKVDVSGAHYARHLAKHYLEHYKLKWCEIQISYAIGIATPLAIYVNSDKGTLDPDFEIHGFYGQPEEMRKLFDGVSFEELAKFGHFGGGK